MTHTFKSSYLICFSKELITLIKKDLDLYEKCVTLRGKYLRQREYTNYTKNKKKKNTLIC